MKPAISNENLILGCRTISIIIVRNLSKKSQVQKREECLESYESIALKLAEDDYAFLCNIHKPYILDIIMIKPSKFTMYLAQVATYTCHT